MEATSKLEHKVFPKDCRRSFGSLVFFCLLIITAPHRPAIAEETPVPGDALVTAAIAEPRVLIPILASDTASAGICGLLFNGLLKYDKDIRLAGDLAESWEVSEDGLEITFHLRKGVRWHDGEPFTSKDVAFTFQKLRDPSVRTPYSGDFMKVKELLTPDPLTVIVRYEQPFSPALSSWAMWIMPEHLLASEDLNDTDFSQRPVGTGPYRFKKWARGSQIDLTANPDYFEGQPFLSRYVSRIIPDATTIFLELQTLTVDASGLSPLQFTRQTQSEFFRKNYNKFRTPGFGYTYLGYNLRHELFEDLRVRQAIDCAVNKDEIVKMVLLGSGRVTTGPFVVDSWAYDDGVRPVPYDPEQAKRLLAEAGWKERDTDGVLMRGGKRFEFTILTNQGAQERLKTAELIQKDLGKIGIKVKIKVLEWSALLADFIDKRRFDAVLLGWSLGRDPDCYDIWHSSKTREGEFNFLGYANPEVDSLLEEARRVFGQEERARLYKKIHRLVYDDQPCLFLFAADSLEIVSSRFLGIEPAPIGIGHDLIRWWVPRDKQRYRTQEI